MFPISNLTKAEKLQLMDALWDDLTHDAEPLESPPWHETILKQTQQKYEQGELKSYDWEEAKQVLRNKLK